MHKTRFGLICLLALQLAACGFHLRGYTSVAADYPPVFLQQNHTDNVLRRLVNQELAVHNIQTDESSRLELRVSDITRGDTVLSLDANVRTAERLLQLTAKLTLLQGDGEILNSTTVQEQRILFTDADNPVGNSAEQTLLVGEMEAAIARRIAEQLARWLDKEHSNATSTGPTR